MDEKLQKSTITGHIITFDLRWVSNKFFSISCLEQEICTTVIDHDIGGSTMEQNEMFQLDKHFQAYWNI